MKLNRSKPSQLDAVGRITPTSVAEDSNCLALLTHYHSLAPMSIEARKLMFFLKSADGAFGAHVQAIQNSYSDFEMLTRKIIRVTGEVTV